MASNVTPKTIFHEHAARGNDIPLEQFVETLQVFPWQKMEVNDRVNFVRDTRRLIDRAFGIDAYMPEQCTVKIINVRGDFADLVPVAEFTLPLDAGKIYMCHDGHRGVFSVDLSRALPLDTFGRVGFFKIDEQVENQTCDGMPADKIFGAFTSNQRQFTFLLRPCIGTTDFINQLAIVISSNMSEAHPQAKSAASPHPFH